MSRRWLVIVLCLVVLAVGAAWLRHLAQAPQGTGAQQIMAQIQRAQAAAEERNVGALMRVVSPNFKDENGITRPALAYQARDQLRDAQRVEVTIPLNDLSIHVAPGGQAATTRFRVEVRITDKQGTTHALNFSPTLQWRKEPVRRYLFFPTTEWRVVGAQGLAGGEGE